ncbi:hypothetical protein IGI04_018391 [Brassica rapa subsp. trilocularis]|uniref:RNase H type-1 domain-containing protein n=1 Tax=Brassica rapa subsp. trilocularis TaxID=1813537 RepID=A0ABQ7MCU4_BRACM|nr:hypothetical protein IGI04_018391 [Brassica rapa subsp. trilocularis]
MFLDFIDYILCLRPSILDGEDSFIWTNNKTGCYSVKSRYNAAIAINSTPQPPFQLHDSFQWYKCVFIDVTGSTINKGSRFQTHVSSACMAEALAVRDALIHASTLGFTKIWLRSNAQELVRAIKAHGKSIELQKVLSDISLLSSYFLFSRLLYVSRFLNGKADSIAKACLCTHQNFLDF